MILLNQLKPRVLLIATSVSIPFFNAITEAFDVLHCETAEHGVECARNMIEPEGVILDLMIAPNGESDIAPPSYGLWVIEQLRDIPICYDIPIAAISQMSDEQLLNRNQLKTTMFHHFNAMKIDEIISYIRD